MNVPMPILAPSARSVREPLADAVGSAAMSAGPAVTPPPNARTHSVPTASWSTPMTAMTSALDDTTPEERLREQTWQASIALDVIFRAAGLSVYYVTVDDDRPDPCITLGTIRAADATTLTELIRKGMAPTFEAATSLGAALLAHGLEVSPPAVRDGRIWLGTLSVSTADQLGRPLGAPVQEASADLTEADEAEQVADRLTAALKQAGGCAVALDLQPECRHEEAEIHLGPIDAPTAALLTARLEFGA